MIIIMRNEHNYMYSAYCPDGLTRVHVQLSRLPSTSQRLTTSPAE